MIPARFAAVVVAGLMLAACGQRDGPPPPERPQAAAETTPGAVEIDDYLRSEAPVGQRFELPALSLAEGGAVREDPAGSLATLAAVLNAYPGSKVRIEVAMANPAGQGPSSAAEVGARVIAEALVRNGLSADRVTSAGVPAPQAGAPRVSLVVTRK